MSTNGYRYIGNGAHWAGVPARDLTKDEFDRLGPLQKRAVTTGGGYEPNKTASKPTEPKPTEPKPAEGGE